MANDSRNIIVGIPSVVGGFFRAVAGTAVPTARTPALAAAFKGAGYVSDAGVTRSIGETSTDIKAWGAGVVRKVRSEHSVVYKLTLIETANEEALKLQNGDANVTVVAATTLAGREITVRIRAAAGAKGAFVIEMADDAAGVRITIPNGEVTARGDITYSDTTAIAYSIEVTAYEDATGVKAYEYITDGVKLAA